MQGACTTEFLQFMPGDSCHRKCTCLHTYKVPSTCEIARAKININRAIAHTKEELRCRNCNTSAISCCHSSILSCFILMGTLDMLQQQSALHFGQNFVSHIQFQMTKSNHSCRQGLLHEINALALISSRHKLFLMSRLPAKAMHGNCPLGHCEVPLCRAMRLIIDISTAALFVL